MIINLVIYLMMFNKEDDIIKQLFQNMKKAKLNI